MMKTFKFISITMITAILILSGCASKPKMKGTRKSSDPLGKLMKKKQELLKKGILSEVATAESEDLQTAINKVELETRGALTRALESKNSNLQKRFIEEVGEEYLEHFTQVSKNVANRVLQGSTLMQNPYHETKDGNYRVYGIMVMDPKAFANALAAEMAANKAMKTRWLASKAYKELDEEARAFEKFKAEQEAGMRGQEPNSK
jgi:hypothetical protein